MLFRGLFKKIADINELFLPLVEETTMTIDWAYMRNG